VLPESHFASEDRLAITLYYFPVAVMRGDIDNIVKPILDALKNHIYIDDRQIQRVLVQKFESGNAFSFRQPSPMLENALEQPKPALYVRISNNPFEDLV
jgi:crossover junction endodeoxyribonuclease RusA